jgi:hypothetical protein
MADARFVPSYVGTWGDVPPEATTVPPWDYRWAEQNPTTKFVPRDDLVMGDYVDPNKPNQDVGTTFEVESTESSSDSSSESSSEDEDAMDTSTTDQATKVTKDDTSSEDSSSEDEEEAAMQVDTVTVAAAAATPPTKTVTVSTGTPFELLYKLYFPANTFNVMGKQLAASTHNILTRTYGEFYTDFTKAARSKKENAEFLDTIQAGANVIRWLLQLKDITPRTGQTIINTLRKELGKDKLCKFGDSKTNLDVYIKRFLEALAAELMDQTKKNSRAVRAQSTIFFNAVSQWITLMRKPTAPAKMVVDRDLANHLQELTTMLGQTTDNGMYVHTVQVFTHHVLQNYDMFSEADILQAAWEAMFQYRVTPNSILASYDGKDDISPIALLPYDKIRQTPADLLQTQAAAILQMYVLYPVPVACALVAFMQLLWFELYGDKFLDGPTAMYTALDTTSWPARRRALLVTAGLMDEDDGDDFLHTSSETESLAMVALRAFAQARLGAANEPVDEPRRKAQRVKTRGILKKQTTSSK